MNASRAEPHIPTPGTVVKGKYRVEALIGSGGMGAVLAARHVVTGKAVALKWLRGSLAKNPEWMRRFVREARAAGRVHHPNVLDVYDVDQHDGVLFLVMERLKGCSLSAALAENPVMPWRKALDVLLPVMRGVQAAHRQGVLHRDLKPANIFLCEDDAGAPLEPKVLDFGVSKIVDPEETDSHLTETGAQLGTPAYMAPEQLASNGVADRRVDVYALGVILYRVLSGRLPHSAPTPASLVVKVVTEDAPALEELVSIPNELAAVVGRALARDRDARYADVGELIAALEQVTTASRPSRFPTLVAANPTMVSEGTPTPFLSRVEEAPPRRERWRTYAFGLVVAAIAGFLMRASMKSIERRGTELPSAAVSNRAPAPVFTPAPVSSPSWVSPPAPPRPEGANDDPASGDIDSPPTPSRGKPHAHHASKHGTSVTEAAGPTSPQHGPLLRPDEF